MAEYSGPARAPRPKNMLDDKRLGMSAKTPNVDKAWASWAWGYWGNQAHITVWTNDPEDQTEKNGNGRIDVKFPASDMLKLVQLIRRVALLEKDDKFWMEIKDYTWFGRERSKTVEVIGTIYVGKKDGVVWISLVSPKRERPKIQFQFGNTMYNILYNGDGQPMSDAEVSVLDALGVAILLEQAIPALGISTYKEPEKKTPPGGNNNGGGNNNRGGNGGGGNNYQKREAAPADDDLDNDIPF